VKFADEGGDPRFSRQSSIQDSGQRKSPESNQLRLLGFQSVFSPMSEAKWGPEILIVTLQSVSEME